MKKQKNRSLQMANLKRKIARILLMQTLAQFCKPKEMTIIICALRIRT